MPKHVHTLLSKNIDTGRGNCAACGDVALAYRTVKGRRAPRCAIAVAAQRRSPNRRRIGGNKWHTAVGPHGLTPVEARLMRQGKLCAICGGSDGLSVDHCHATGTLRGVLCRGCNIGLGCFKDNPETMDLAREYLTRYRVGQS